MPVTARLSSKFYERFGDDIATELAGLRTEFRTELDTVRRDLLKWMFIYWSGLFVGLGGMITGMAVFLK